MSLTGAYVIAAIVLARIALKKAPKLISYCLWAVAGFRLLIPFSVESVLSLVPFGAQPITQGIAASTAQHIDTGLIYAASGVVVTAVQQPSISSLQIVLSLGTYIWLVGFLVMLACGVMSFIKLKQKMKSATHVSSNIFEATDIETPFVLGVFPPVIYIPTSLTERERKYIILHEQTHIRRHDHLVKFVAYFILCLHWFNPLAWAAFLLMGVDMEMSCDERVLKEMGTDTKKDYSQSLIRLATQPRFVSGSPLAFGEGGVKERVKNILSFRKTSRIITISAALLAVVFSMGFAVDRVTGADMAAQPDVRAGITSTGARFRQGGSGGTQQAVEPRALPDTDVVIWSEPKPGSMQSVDVDMLIDVLSRQSSCDREYMALKVSEINTRSFGDIMYSNILPYGRHYYNMTAWGDNLIFSYTELD